MHPAIFPAAVKVDNLWSKEVGYQLVITSANDSRHSKHSRHWWGGAIDMRTWTTETSGRQLSLSRRTELRNKVKRTLGPDWNVLDEGDHFHIGYKPAR